MKPCKLFCKIKATSFLISSHSKYSLLAVDRRAVVRAITNLIDNAVRYSDQDQQVTVGVEVFGETAAISVKDDGVGIPRAELERVFERFYRVDRARSRETGGTGLGLAIVRHVAENHGGRVLVESKPGKGSTFTIELPLPASR